jgi:hypothetical protein
VDVEHDQPIAHHRGRLSTTAATKIFICLCHGYYIIIIKSI